MSYELHIHRAESHLEAESHPIPAEEWEALAEQRLVRQGDYPIEVPEGERPIPVYVNEANTLSYGLLHGEIIVTGVRDEAQIAEPLEIARALGAKLEGDDGELYD